MVSFLKKFLKKFTKKNRLNEEEQLIFLKRLLHLLKLGYPILEALDVMKWDVRLKTISATVQLYLRKGWRIDKALDKANFHHTIVAYLYFVSINGDLISSIEKCVTMFEQRLNYINKFNKVIRYPSLLLLFFTFLFIFLKRSVLPSFIELFQTNSSASKSVTISLILIDFFIVLIFICFLIVIIFCFVWYKVKENVPIETKIKFYNKIPLYRHFLKMQTSYYLSTHISMFLHAGLSMKEVLRAMKDQDKLPIISYYATLMTNQLSDGHKVDHLLMALPFIEKNLSYIFQKNDDYDTLQRDLTAYADYIAEEMEDKVMRLIQIIQPTIFIFIALFIIFIYIALMWPMFQMIKTI